MPIGTTTPPNTAVVEHHVIPAPIPETLQDQVHTMALDSCRALCVEGMARVDFFYDDRTGDLWINEINTLPGFTSLSMCPCSERQRHWA